MALSMDLVNLSPKEFIAFLKKEEIKRFFFVYDPENKNLISSHEQLQPVAEYIQSDKRDFAEHEGLFFQLGTRYDILQGAFIHRTCRGQGAGRATPGRVPRDTRSGRMASQPTDAGPAQGPGEGRRER